jgi:hypothetical protein
MKTSEIGVLMAILKAAYPRQVIQPLTLQVYTKALEPHDANEIAGAIEFITHRSRFFPTIAEILERAALTRTGAPDSAVAWGEVLAELRRVGHTSSPSYPHPLIGDSVKAIGGWRRLCESTDMTADRSRFHEAYAQLIRAQVDAFITNALPPMAQHKEIAE